MTLANDVLNDIIEARAKQMFEESRSAGDLQTRWDQLEEHQRMGWRQEAGEAINEATVRGEPLPSGTDVQLWADEAMYSAEPVEQTGPRVYLINATSDPLGTLASACAMYEGKKVLRSQVTDEMRRYYWEDIKKTKLKAPLEFIEIHFLIEGVTRAFTHQMVRQRTGVFVQESMRFAVKENMAAEIDLPVGIRPGSHQAKLWEETVQEIEDAYKSLIANGVPAEDARGLAPTNVRTRLHYKSDFRNFTEQVGNRLCTQAQFEWRLVITRMVEAMRAYTSFPQVEEASRCDNWQWQLIAQDDYFRPPCYMAGHCTFRGDMDRHCKIRDRVEDNKFDEIDPREWLADPTSARKAPVKS